MRDGLWHHGVTVAEADVAVCFYGDLFRRDPESDVAVAFEQSRAGVAEALSNLAGSELAEALGQAAIAAAFDRTIDILTVMATQPDLRERVAERIEAVVGDDTRAVVAHSLGTLVAYRALCRHPRWRVHTLVTLGSPLGAPMVFGSLDPAPEGGLFQEEWIRYYHPGSLQGKDLVVWNIIW